MDSQLAFFLVRPAKAMGRKGADPNAVVLVGHLNGTADRARDIPLCKTDISAQEMWGWGVTSPEAVAMAGQGMDAPVKGSRVSPSASPC